MRALPLILTLAFLTSCGGSSDRELHPEEYDEAGNWKYGKDSSFFEDEKVDGANRDEPLDVYDELARQSVDDADGESSGDDGEIKAGETYPQFDRRRDSYNGSRGSFGGHGCTVNCGGHEAGYEWAQDKGITDSDQCGGKSWSFEEGCRAYAEENSEN
jgi:hypothetical protein